jgi:uncharacterized protein (TIGR02594 family)
MAPRSTRVVPETEVRSPARSFAQSLDTFYAPARDRRGEQSIQQGAQAFSAILGEQAQRNKAEQRADELQQGVLDAMREEAGQELLGVKTGSIFRQHSKFYMMGLNETRGKARGAKFKNDVALAYEQWDGRHIDDDGTAFREWMNGQVSTFMGGLGNNQYMIAGALPTVNEVANNFASRHTAFTAARLEEESFAAYDEIVAGIFTDLSDGKFTIMDDMGEEGTNWNAVIDRIAEEADDMYTTDGAQANDRIVQSAIRYANINNDPDAILALARAHDSGKLKLSLTNRERLANGMDAVEADIARNTSKNNARTEAEDKARQKAALDGWAATLQENPYADLPSFEQVGDYATFQKMTTLQDALISSSKVENPTITTNARINFEARLADAGDAGERLKVLTGFVAANPTALSGSDVSRYMGEIIKLDDPSSLVNDPLVKQYRSGFGEMLGQFQNDDYSVEKVSLLKTMGQRYYDDYMLRASGSVDMSDPEAISAIIDKAEAFAIRTLTKEFPSMMADGMGDPEGARGAAGGALGVPQALEAEQAAAAAEAAAIFQEDAGIVPTGEQPVVQPDEQSAVQPTVIDQVVQSATQIAQDAGILPTAKVPPHSTTGAQEDVGVIDDPEVEDEAESQNPEVIRSKPDSFYQEVLRRFTDGTDDRVNVSPSVLVETAKRVLGADENAQNSLISRFLADGGVNLDPSETAWCAGFMNAVLAQNGIDGTKSLQARSFLKWGEPVSTPKDGDIVVISRGLRDGWQGHVGIFQGFDANGNIRILGGNQGNAVSIASYPADRLLGYRRPTSGKPSTANTLQSLANGE